MAASWRGGTRLPRCQGAQSRALRRSNSAAPGAHAGLTAGLWLVALPCGRPPGEPWLMKLTGRPSG